MSEPSRMLDGLDLPAWRKRRMFEPSSCAGMVSRVTRAGARDPKPQAGRPRLHRWPRLWPRAGGCLEPRPLLLLLFFSFFLPQPRFQGDCLGPISKSIWDDRVAKEAHALGSWQKIRARALVEQGKRGRGSAIETGLPKGLRKALPSPAHEGRSRL
eukprot:358209-Chlamydomonas_euryale.AAC.1